MQRRGILTLPKAIRAKFGLDEPGAQVEIVEQTDGTLLVRPLTAVPASQRWFWTTEWQDGEHEVDEAVAAGDVKVYDTADEFLDSLPD